uniref:Uncharacterized protein n=1 Tax=Micrurus corallinus TaxID=54390 RepID=A0A2D4ERL4_MICCO
MWKILSPTTVRAPAGKKQKIAVDEEEQRARVIVWRCRLPPSSKLERKLRDGTRKKTAAEQRCHLRSAVQVVAARHLRGGVCPGWTGRFPCVSSHRLRSDSRESRFLAGFVRSCLQHGSGKRSQEDEVRRWAKRLACSADRG